MTPEEIRSTIEQMLAVQRQIQESQIRNTDNIARLETQTQENRQLIQENRQLIRENSRFIQENGQMIREFANSNRENIAILVEEISKLAVDQREKFNQFYGYHIAADSDRLNIIARLNQIEQEVERIKRKLDNQTENRFQD